MHSIAPSPQNPVDLTYDPFAVVHGNDDLLTVRTAFSSGTYVIAVYGELDVSTVGDLRRHMLRAEASAAQEIVLDLSALHFMDSSGVRLLHEAHMRSRADGHRLRLGMARLAPAARALDPPR